ncbi:MAG: tyrosine-protein phosphatase [Acidobacteriota bacterium]
MMKRTRSNRSVGVMLIAALLLTSGLPALGKDKGTASKGGSAAGVSVENFGQVNEHLYRGGQPNGSQFQELAALGIKTIVDLRGDAERSVRADAERAGLRYVNLPLAPKSYPQPEVAARFLEIVSDQNNWPVYVHCAGGRHRTGAMVAVYRMSVDHWSIERAYDEMKQYDFYTSWGHACYKDYVFDYARSQARLASGQTGPTPASSNAATRTARKG